MLCGRLQSRQTGLVRYGRRPAGLVRRDNPGVARRKKDGKAGRLPEVYRRIRGRMPPPERVIEDERRRLEEEEARREIEREEARRQRPEDV